MEKKPIGEIPVPAYDTSVRKRGETWLPGGLSKITRPETALQHIRKQEHEIKRQLKKWDRKDTMTWRRRKACQERISAAKRKIEGLRGKAIELIRAEILPETPTLLAPSESEVSPPSSTNGAQLEGANNESN